MAAVRNVVLFVHRWLGVLLCSVFLIWFPSGIGMMYWQNPEVTAADRLKRSPAIDPTRVHLSPRDAAAKAGLAAPSKIRLNTFDGRPAYRLDSGGSVGAVVYADTGELQTVVGGDMMSRIASSWTGRPASHATVTPLEDVDQWTIQTFRRNAPLWKYSWPSGEQVYISRVSGEVVQATTTASRVGAYLGPIPHWLYFTPLRRHGTAWARVVVWSSALGTLTALLGVTLGVWIYSPTKRYRLAGASSSIPYRGQKRWHMVLGLIFGTAAATWAFSGMLSMDPFPARTSGTVVRGDRSIAPSIQQALRGQLSVDSEFTADHPRAAFGRLEGLDVRELEWTSFAGEPIYVATLAGGDTRIVPRNGAAQRQIGEQRIADTVRQAAGPDGISEMRLLERYDFYYLDRHGVRPLPVLRVALNDRDSTLYYIDPKTGRVTGRYSSEQWVSRWAYHALHSLDFPWLYNHRPLWDIVVITFMLGGTALSLTSVVLAWRVVGRLAGRTQI